VALPDETNQYYLAGKEAERLFSPRGALERLRTQTILTRYLPRPPAEILDVGGAAGAHAFPLAERGYRVHLIDPIDLHLKQAKTYSKESSLELASIRLGDARHLDFPESTADAVLLLGPLYHLVERSDRLLALAEARRVLKPDGMLFAAAISRFASLIDGLASGFFRDPQFRQIVAADLATGQHRNPTPEPFYFTTAFFHRPADLATELSEAGFPGVKVLAVEGPAWSAGNFGQAWEDPVQRETLLSFLSKVEEEPSILGASAHLLAVAKRPN
jgi:ubiquinone/menaquinone biosynthesis C-methylase UbiE